MVLTELKCLKTGHLIHDHLFEYSTISSRETSACLRWLSDDFHNKLRNKNGVYFLPGGLFECCILRMKILMFLKPCFFRLNNRIDRKEANKSIFQWQKKKSFTRMSRIIISICLDLSEIRSRLSPVLPAKLLW